MGDNNKEFEMDSEGYRTVIRISVDKEGKKKMTIAPVAKDVIIDLLTDATKFVAMKPDNVVKVPAGLSAGGVRNWIGNKMRKR